MSKRKIDNQGLVYNHISYYVLEKGIIFIDFKDYKVIYKSFKELVGVEDTNYSRCFATRENIQICIPGYLMIFDYQLSIQKIYVLPLNLSNKSFKDSKGNIWMTDLANGISLIPNTQIQASYYLQNKKIQKINKIDNQLFVGLTDRGFYQFSSKNSSFYQLNEFNRGNGEIYQIKEDTGKSENYFISASNYYTFKNSKLTPCNIKDYLNKQINLLGIKDVTFLNNNYFMICSSGLIVSENPEKYSVLFINKNGLMFTESFQNNIYVAGSDGLHFLENNKLKKPNKNSLLDVSVTNLLSSKKNLFVGTDGRGIYLLDNKNKIYYLKETDGLSVQRIIQKENHLWLATQKGVYKIKLNKENLEQSIIVDAFYDTDGLLQNNTNDIYIENDVLYAASDVGLAKINLANPLFKKKPNLYFKTQTDTLQYQNEARDNITISFASLDFVNQEHLSYSYRLLPLQKKWTKTETKILNFSNLDPKQYTLEVKVTDQHNNQTIKKLYLNVVPEWWQTTVAKVAFGILSLLLFLGLLKIIKTQITKKEEAKAQQDKRIAGLELQALRSQMNPHFVHNSLNAIQYFIQRNEVELSENYLSKFSQLIRLFFEYSRRQNITIKEELELLKNYLEIEKLRFEEKLNYTISVCEAFDVEEQLIPSMLLQPIVENAVNHGIFHKKENGTIYVTFKYINENTFEITIEDNGIGINKSKALFKASSKNYQSNSSKVLQERLDLLNLSKEWTIAYTSIDKSEKDSTKTGTLITLLFKQHFQS